MKINKSNKLSSQKIAYLSVYVALMIAITFIPYTGYLNIGPIAITTIPVFISIATWHLGWSGGMTTSIVFGLGSYLKSLAGMGSPLFISYPELAIAPRILSGLFLCTVVTMLKDIKLWKVILTSALAVIGNTFFVTSWYFLMKEYRNEDALKSFSVWIGLIYVNFLVELPTGIFLGILTYKMTIYLKTRFVEEKTIRY